MKMSQLEKIAKDGNNWLEMIAKYIERKKLKLIIKWKTHKLEIMKKQSKHQTLKQLS